MVWISIHAHDFFTQRILIISGPNAGGKSVCLKTVGLLQYMLQSGLLIPMHERSHAGIFSSIFIDIGDEQSIEDDLSTYSSHLTNMKIMMKSCNKRSLILIDEFGGGTEPQIGGAIAEAVLKRFNQKQTFGVITTHYQNLKHFAEDHEGVVNGAMLYDRHLMQALFQLQIGNPGSSFAVEIARKIGLPEDVIADASEIVGSEYINADKYLQDIVRDKRYWEGKRQTIRQREKHMEETIERYQTEIEDLQKSRKDILRKAKEEVELVFDDHLPVCHVISDRNRIHQVISSFVNNAMKFTSEGSIHVGYKLKDGELEFYVEDTGIGIEKEQLPHIFERFVKLNSFVHGTGLGLSICQSIVEQLGGRIGVDSEKGKGSRFWFTIPGVIVTEEMNCAR